MRYLDAVGHVAEPHLLLVAVVVDLRGAVGLRDDTGGPPLHVALRQDGVPWVTVVGVYPVLTWNEIQGHIFQGSGAKLQLQFLTFCLSSRARETAEVNRFQSDPPVYLPIH